MNKKAIVIVQDNKPVYVAEVKTFESPEQFKKLKAEAEQNCEEMKKAHFDEKYEFVNWVKQELDARVREITILRAEVDLLRGRITEEEYNKIVKEE